MTTPEYLPTPAPYQSTASIVRAWGLKVGDTIEGRQDIGSGWVEARLTLLYLGESVCVWMESKRDDWRTNWSPGIESAVWSLSCRRWRKSNPEVREVPQ